VASDNPTDGLMTNDAWQAWEDTVMAARRHLATIEQSPYIQLLEHIW
jgi:hypothetical protein